MSINLTQTAKELRRNATDAERLLWRCLKAKQLDGLKFRRQEQIGHFIVDFVCYEKGLIVEADGGQHALEKEKDEERTDWLNSQGVAVLRFWNNEILTNIEGVLEVIRRECDARGLPLSPTLSHACAPKRYNAQARGEREDLPSMGLRARPPQLWLLWRRWPEALPTPPK